MCIPKAFSEVNHADDLYQPSLLAFARSISVIPVFFITMAETASTFLSQTHFVERDKLCNAVLVKQRSRPSIDFDTASNIQPGKLRDF